MKNVIANIKRASLLGSVLLFAGCASVGNALNPFAETPPPVAYLGEPNDHALSTDTNKAEDARAALDGVARYPRAHQPQPVYPVIKPAVVRLMWIPDHLNPVGDLVPAHYYYLKVMDDTWAVTDAFEKEKLLGQSGAGSNIPFTRE